MFALPIDTDQIIVTASRFSEDEATKSPASVLVLDARRIERLGEPLVPALLRLAPSIAVTTQGPAGLLTEVRIRGAENNHTLLFIDGIRANDPATGDFARFELLNADLVSRIEVVRGPQSALWGSDAIGGVIAVSGHARPGFGVSAEAGASGFARANAYGGLSSGPVSLAGAVGWQSSSGIDSFGAPGGDKDGYRNLSGRLRATVAVGPSVTIGASGFILTGRSQFDGYDPNSFERTDTLDSSRNRLAAGRIWAEINGKNTPWTGQVGFSRLQSSNRNFLGHDPVNRTGGTRQTVDGQVKRRLTIGKTQHDLVLAVEAERETFTAKGIVSGLPTDQERDRDHQAVTAEWRASAGRFSGDIAVRRDRFSRFKDSTSLRASALANLGSGFALAASYADGIAQPTFFDLFGFFPNNFVGNPLLKAESSSGFEGSLRFRRGPIAASVTAYRQRLHEEIVDTFDFVTLLSSTANSAGESRRWGIEGEIAWNPSNALRLSANYAYLRATQPEHANGKQITELRRPTHGGSITVDGTAKRWSYGASLAYVGARRDFLEVQPFGIVRVAPYWLADARVAYAVTAMVQVHVRASNLFNSKYEESAGYRTEGRGVFLGFRLADRRSSR